MPNLFNCSAIKLHRSHKYSHGFQPRRALPVRSRVSNNSNANNHCHSIQTKDNYYFTSRTGILSGGPFRCWTPLRYWGLKRRPFRSREHCNMIEFALIKTTRSFFDTSFLMFAFAFEFSEARIYFWHQTVNLQPTQICGTSSPWASRRFFQTPSSTGVTV
jgi:hypothetical protein